MLTTSIRLARTYANRRWVAIALLLALLPGTVLATDQVNANGHVYMRKDPNIKSKVLEVLNPDAQLEVIGTVGEWYKVSFGRTVGYVRQDVVTIAGDTSGVLKEGSQGEIVQSLQLSLQSKGFYKGDITGSYGNLTAEAVRQFQKKNGLDADGIAGTKTQELLLGTGITTNESNPSQPTVNQVQTQPAVTDGLLKLGVQNDEVRQLQTQLKAVGLYNGSISGNYGNLTEEAVKKFQRKKGLSADGVAGTATLEALGRAQQSATTQQQTADTSDSGLLKVGVKAVDEVKKLQTQLKAMGFYKESITGNFGLMTEAALRAFQKKNGLSPDGVAGIQTINVLYSGGAQTANGGKSTAPTYSGKGPNAGDVIFAKFLSIIRPKYKAGTNVTIFDFETGLTWQCRFLTLDKHADGEPITSDDTNVMYRAFGNQNTWNPKAVWYTMPDGKTYMGSIHNMGHGSDRISGNNFSGLLCMHFPRNMKEAEETGPYAVSHQKAILAGWEKTQKLAGY